MPAAEAVLKGSCEIHADRPAIERCASCGRAVCLACAVPFRGRTLCTTCASRELGDPDPVEPTRTSRRVPPAAMVSFAAGLAATVAPWDRFGPRTSLLSAWRWTADPWSVIVCLCLALATGIAIVGWRLPTRLALWAAASFGVGAGAATLWMLMASPDYVRHTPAPYVALVGAVAGAVLVGIAMRGPRRLG